MIRFNVLMLCGAFLAAVPLGCKSGPPVGQVEGKVTFKGAPVTDGRITFFDAKTGHTGEALLGVEGKYNVKTLQGGLVVGEYTVTVTPLTEIVDLEPGKTPPTDVEKPAPNIPKKYRSPSTTPLKNVKVKEGKNVFDVDMTP